MALQRIILEMGTGNDLYGEDYTKAAVRAMQDAIHHSSITLFRTMPDMDRDEMQVEVTIGVQQPDNIDKDEVASQLPFGTVKVNCVKGGLNVTQDSDLVTVIATAAVGAWVDIPEGRYASA